MINIAILGYGTIGSGVDEVLRVNRDVIAQRVGDVIDVKYVLDLRDFPDDPIQEKIVHDYNVILNDPEVLIVVEAMGGEEPAHTFAVQALERGKHFATSNKALIARFGAELIALGQKKNRSVLFEASVGGGIPIIRPINDCLTADVLEEISGILNGTTNYMMTSMAENGSEFDDVLKEAQRLGYAEADPTADIEGHDACRKIAILTSLASRKQVDFEDISTQGITGISATDMKYAAAMGRRIKLLAMSRKTKNSYCALVAPFLLDSMHPLYSVNDVFNAVFVGGNVLGDAMFYGAGAGKLPTASAVVSDIIEIAKNPDIHIASDWSAQKITLDSELDLTFRYFVRTADDAAAVEAAFGKVEYISVPEITEETAFLTESMDGHAYEAAAAKLGSVLQMIRVD